jgi:hypothetical protein
MKKLKPQNAYLPLALLLTVFMAGCGSGGGSSTPAATDTPDTTAPTVTLTTPAAGAVDVAINTKKITATFSEDMTSTTLTGTTFTVDSGAVAGAVTYADAVKTAIFTPGTALTEGAHTATITTGAKDLAGNPLAVAKTWTFTIGATTTRDDTAPTVISTFPARNDGDVRTTQNVSATFSEPMDPATITPAKFKLELTSGIGTIPPVPGTLTYAGTTVTFTPSSKLDPDDTYTATIATVVTDLAGNELGVDSHTPWNFTTALTDPAGPQPPVLGEAGGFLILASSAITTTTATATEPASALTGGDLGIMDEARTAYAGFTPGVNPGEFDELKVGLSYAHSDTDPALIPSPYATTIAFINQTRTDLGIAYDFLAADPNPGSATIVCPTELGGETLSPGVYKTGNNVLVTAGALVLDAQNDANAVFIFSIDGTLTVGAPSGAISLINGAQAKNVYFRTGGKTTIEAYRHFYGNVFAWSQVNVLTGADINGRLFAVTEQVTLDSNDITAP